MIPHVLAALLLSLLLVGCDDDSDSDNDSVSVDVSSARKISERDGGFGETLDNNDQFGRALANLGNLDGDDSIDIAVGAPGDDEEEDDSGAVWILFLDEGSSSVVRSKEKIPSDDNELEDDGLDSDDAFGSALTTLDGVTLAAADDVETVLAAGAPGDDDDGDDSGSVWLLALNDDGELEDSRKITFTGNSQFLDLDADDEFGSALARVRDFDANGISDLAAGSPGARINNRETGVVWLLSLDTAGEVVAGRRIPEDDSELENALSSDDRFGSAIVEIGDLDGDGVSEIAVGAPEDGKGAVWILFMAADGRVRDQQQISEDRGSFFDDLGNDARFGSALAATGDLDGDGVPDLAVGAPRDTGANGEPGAVWILFLNEDGRVLAELKITDSENGFDGPLDDDDRFGAALADIGNFDEDGATELELAVGASGDDDTALGAGGDDNGAVWLLAAEVEAEDDGGLLGSGRGRSDDSILGGILKDQELGSPLSDSDFASPLDGGLSSPLDGTELSTPLRGGGLNSPLR